MACAGGGGTFAGSEKDKVAGRSGDWEKAKTARNKRDRVGLTAHLDKRRTITSSATILPVEPEADALIHETKIFRPRIDVKKVNCVRTRRP